MLRSSRTESTLSKQDQKEKCFVLALRHGVEGELLNVKPGHLHNITMISEVHLQQ